MRAVQQLIFRGAIATGLVCLCFTPASQADPVGTIDPPIDPQGEPATRSEPAAAPRAATATHEIGFAIVSDHVVRGISQNDARPALQGRAALRHASGFHTSLLLSTLDVPTSNGRVQAIGDVGLAFDTRWGIGVDVGLTGYTHLFSAPNQARDGFWEVYTAATLKQLVLKMNFDPDDRDSYYEARYGIDLGSGFLVDFLAGEYSLRQARNYTVYGVGVRRAFDRIGVAIHFTDTSQKPEIPVNSSLLTLGVDYRF